MKKVLINFYSKNNLGDDLFIKIIAERYENYFSVILSKPNKFLKGIGHLTIYKSIPLYLLCKVIEKTFKTRNLWLNLLSKKHDLLVYVGGSIFIEHNNLNKWKRESRFYKKLSIPYYILGSNFGPYQSPDFVDVVRDILQGAKDVCFRDQASYETFKDLPTTRTSTDIAFSLNTSKYKIKNDKIAVFSIVDGNDRFDAVTTNKYERETASLTERLIKDGYKIVYMPFCKFEGDEAAMIRILGILNEKSTEQVEIFNYDGNLEEALALIAKSEIIIAGRFHAAILGLLFSKKIVPMAYSDKTINILKDINFTGEVIDIRKINEFDGSKFDFSAIPITDVSKQIKLAETQFQELDKVLVRRK